MSFIVLLKMDVTSGMQPPQPVPALVHDFTSPRLLQLPSLTTLVTSALVTLWHEQICVSSSRSSPSSATSLLAPRKRSLGGTSSSFWLFTMGTSLTGCGGGPGGGPPGGGGPAGGGGGGWD